MMQGMWLVVVLIEACVLGWYFSREWHRVSVLFLDKGWLQQSIPAYPYWGLVVIFAWVILLVEANALAALLLFFGFGLYQLAYFDATTGFLPDRWTLALLWAALLVNSQSWLSSPDQAIIGATVGYGFLYLLNAGYIALKRYPGLGGGDMKLLAALGALLGWMALPYVLFMASALGLVFVAIKRFIKKEPCLSIPFGPFLALAGIGVLGFRVIL